MLISVNVPKHLTNVSNGRLRKIIEKNDVRLSKLEIAKAFAVNDAIAPTFGDVIDKSVIEYGFKGQGKIISNFGVGVDHIDIETCKKFNIPVTNTPDVLTDATAEISILLMLMVARRALEGEKQIIEDAVEALIAAIYFDGGLQSVNKFVSKFIYPNIKKLSQDPGKKDYKTRLQEHFAKIGKKVSYDNTIHPTNF